MYEIRNISKRPVFVEGVCLNHNESTEVNEVTSKIENLHRLNLIRINSVEDKTTEVLTEEGYDNKRKRRSSKTLNE